jgi:hypothetical protein
MAFCQTIVKIKLKNNTVDNQIDKMDRVGVEPTTSALYSLLKWRLMHENSTAGQIPASQLFFFLRALHLCRRKYGT